MGRPNPKYKGEPKNTYAINSRPVWYARFMRTIPDRAILTVLRHSGLWAVEHDGEHFGHSPDKEIARAAAHRRARQMQDNGRACQVLVAGDLSNFGAR